MRQMRARGGDIQTVGNLLAKYKNLRAPQGTVVQVCIKAVKEVCGFTLQTHHVRYNPHTQALAVTLSGPGKSELLLRKKQILAACAKELRSHSPKTII